MPAPRRGDQSAASDQGEVRADIAEKAERLSARSATGAMAAIYASHKTDVASFVRVLTPVEGQSGAVFAIQGQVIGLDLFDHQATLRKLLPKLVRSYALDALDAFQRRSETPPDHASEATEVRTWLTQVREAEDRLFPAAGEGEDLRFSGTRLTGGALVARERVVHLSAFRTHGPERADRTAPRSRIRRPSARRRH